MRTQEKQKKSMVVGSAVIMALSSVQATTVDELDIDNPKSLWAENSCDILHDLKQQLNPTTINSNFRLFDGLKETDYTHYEYKSIDSEYRKIRGRILSFKNLNEDWDGYGGVVPSDDIIQNSLVLLELFEDLSVNNARVMLSGDGEISFFWKKNGYYSELTIEDANVFSYFVKNETEMFDFEDQPIPNNFEDLQDKIQEQLLSV